MFSVIKSDALEFLNAQEPASCDLIFSSPPYEKARLYLESGEDLGIARDTEEWVAWMVQVVQASLRVCRGLVAFVVEGQTRNFRYSAGPVLLMADLHRAGVHLRKPPIFHRIGIPGSGGPDWLRNDYEFIVCATNGGKLAWSDNTAMGWVPKWAPGGAMSHRLPDGNRRDQWGRESSTGNRDAAGNRKKQTNAGVKDVPCGGCGETEPEKRCLGCLHDFKKKPRLRTKGGSPKDSCKGRRVPAGTTVNGDLLMADAYLPPVLANPGNSIAQTYTAAEVADIVAAYEQGDWRHHLVGGGLMGGDAFVSQNEAPYPESLCEFFIRSFSPPGGKVCDPFTGSGTTGTVSVRWGMDFVGCDLRESQVKLATARITNETPLTLLR